MKLTPISGTHLFVMEGRDKIRWHPNKIHLTQYTFEEGETPSFREEREAAARLIFACKGANTWCGVRLSRIKKLMQQELVVYASQKMMEGVVLQHNLDEQTRYNRELLRFINLCLFTLGLYLFIHFFFGEKLKKPDIEVVPKMTTPQSLQYTHGEDEVMRGFERLRQNGRILMVPHADDEVIFPTPTLLDIIPDDCFG